MKPLNWATLGCGVIANELATALARQNRHLYSVANRTHEKAVAFEEKYQISKVYDRLEDVFTDPDVDIIYISTPQNSNEQHEAIALAEKNHVILAEAMTIFHMPIYRKLAEIISFGTLGPLRLIQVNFGSYKEYDMNNRFFNRNLAGGALLDIGVYALSLIRWFFAETANQVLSQVKYAPTGVDEQAGILLMNPAGEMATVTLSLHAKQPKRATIAFDKGYIEIFEYPRAMEATITYTGDGHKETISAGETADALSYEVADMEAAVCSGDLSTIESLMHLNYSQDVMHIMTEIRNNWGMKYPEEE